MENCHSGLQVVEQNLGLAGMSSKSQNITGSQRVSSDCCQFTFLRNNSVPADVSESCIFYELFVFQELWLQCFSIFDMNAPKCYYIWADFMGWIPLGWLILEDD